MWGKRFPLPEFNYEPLKNLEWTEPDYMGNEVIEKLMSTRVENGAGVPVCLPVPASDEFFERFGIVGEFRHAVLCISPNTDVRVTGRSHAWKKQRLIVVDSLDTENSNVILDWKTTRPMSTRLGPTEGTTIAGGVWFAMFTHIIGDHLVGNRTLERVNSSGSEKSFSVLSSSDPELNDFHDCNLYAEW